MTVDYLLNRTKKIRHSKEGNDLVTNNKRNLFAYITLFNGNIHHAHAELIFRLIISYLVINGNDVNEGKCTQIGIRTYLAK